MLLASMSNIHPIIPSCFTTLYQSAFHGYGASGLPPLRDSSADHMPQSAPRWTGAARSHRPGLCVSKLIAPYPPVIAIFLRVVHLLFWHAREFSHFTCIHEFVVLSLRDTVLLLVSSTPQVFAASWTPRYAILCWVSGGSRFVSCQEYVTENRTMNLVDNMRHHKTHYRERTGRLCRPGTEPDFIVAIIVPNRKLDALVYHTRASRK